MQLNRFYQDNLVVEKKNREKNYEGKDVICFQSNWFKNDFLYSVIRFIFRSLLFYCKKMEMMLDILKNLF